MFCSVYNSLGVVVYILTNIGRVVGVSATTLTLMALPLFGDICMKTKTCTICKKVLTVDHFGKSTNDKYGVRGRCKPCHKQRTKEVDAARLERNKNRVISKNTTKQCTKCHKTMLLDFFAKHDGCKYGVNSKCKQCANVCNKRNYYKAIDYQKTRSKTYRAKNKEKIHARNKIYSFENRERISQYGKKHFQENREQYKIRGQRRIARQNNLISDLTIEQWKQTIEFFNGCAYCGRNDITMVQEHVVPVIGGGHHTKSNIVSSCQYCNSSKGTKDYKDFAQGKFKSKITRFVNKYELDL